MTDTNPTRARANKNKKAFEDVFGDPFSLNDDDGHYSRLKHRSVISATRANVGEGKATVNPARPNTLDFCCDVERVVYEVLGDDQPLFTRFIEAYVLGTDTIEASHLITLHERQYIEQRMGRLLLTRGISPVSKYFTVTKRRSNDRSE